MKYIKLTGWGNKKTHYVPIKAISCISETVEVGCQVYLSSGNSINVLETCETVELMLEELGATIVDELDVTDLFDSEDDDEIIRQRMAQLYDELDDEVDEDELPF